ncbi:helix-turn-helix domain-containing protein [uncultured Clostridium sp.]|uniref:helix-turn-helix domain-containing protein n=1 Tax=uncultured Clostridium sp. TaxID=59620 RepID=UPI0025EF127B|nr:helix-turn-helix transcriptional regulator [uncultured Clostridium sp.]
MFTERLKEYRNTLHLKMNEMADKLQVSDSYYSLIENGKRSPSKTLIEKLVVISELPEEYWIYGINRQDYVNTRDEFKSLKKALDSIFETDTVSSVSEIFDENHMPKDLLGRFLVAALESDISYMLEKRKK